MKKDDAADGKLIKQEHQEKGAVSAIVYLHYIKACGVAYVVSVMTLMVAQYAVLIGSNFLSLTFFSMFAIVIVRISGQCCQVHIVCISHLTVIVKTIMFTVSLTFCIIW